jgi:hypothetical protein
VIILQVEQSELPGLSGLSGLKLLAAELAQRPPAVGVAADHDGVGLGHDTPAQAASAWADADFCKECRKSAARCAWDAALNIARLSFLSALIHEPI